MKISGLIDIHQKNLSKESLVNNLGDGFLISKNSIYRKIRTEAVKKGFSFTEGDSSSFHALPLTQLENILEQKKIPYVDNVTVLKHVLKKAPDVGWHDLAGGLKKNYIFHESCHAVARDVFKNHTRLEKNLLIQILIEESFANSCELVAMVDVQDQAHRIFYEQNSYTWLPEVISILKNAITHVGAEKTFKFVLLCYLYSNFLRHSLSEKDLRLVLDFCELSDLDNQKIKVLRSLAKVPFTLDYEFRTLTTGLHLKMLKIRVNLPDYDFMNELASEPEYKTCIQKLAHTLLSGN